MTTSEISTLDTGCMIFQATLQHAKALSILGSLTFYDSHKDSAPLSELKMYMKKVYSVASIKREIANPVNIYQLIKSNDAIAGFSKMELNIKHDAIKRERISKMDQIYLLEPFHGLGLGAKLLTFNIEYSKAHGQKGMWLVVWVGNETAISFYEKFGFQIVTRAEFQLTDNHLSPCYIMLLDY